MMANRQASEREEIEALLPWHAAGTLNRNDAERVEQALASDRELASRFQLVREELAETIHLNETLGAPSSRAMERLFAKIDAEAPAERRAHVASPGIATRISEFFASLSPRTLAYATGAAAVVLMLQAGVIANLVSDGGRYQVASIPTDSTIRGGSDGTLGEGMQMWIEFAPSATAADITRLLEANKAAVVGGPGLGGMYRVRVAMTGLPKEELARLVNRLQEDKSVVRRAVPIN
jgi:hypothetical protein